MITRVCFVTKGGQVVYTACQVVTLPLSTACDLQEEASVDHSHPLNDNRCVIGTVGDRKIKSGTGAEGKMSDDYRPLSFTVLFCLPCMYERR